MAGSGLITIPLVDLGDRGPLGLIEAAAERAETLRCIGERHYTHFGLCRGDAIGQAWLERSRNPHRRDIASPAARLSGPGLTALNLSYQYACTGLASPDPSGGGDRPCERMPRRRAGGPRDRGAAPGRFRILLKRQALGSHIRRPAEVKTG